MWPCGAKAAPPSLAGMRIGDLMRREVLTVTPDARVTEAAQRMDDHRVGALVVIRQGDMVGVITERDLLTALAQGRVSSATSVADCMTADPLTATPETDSQEAAAQMLDAGIRHLPVVRDGAVVGMVSARDLLIVAAWPAFGLGC
jgi:CBS domain-containing protein